MNSYAVYLLFFALSFLSAAFVHFTEDAPNKINASAIFASQISSSKLESKFNNCTQQILFIRGGNGTGGFLEGGTDDQLSDITDFSTNNRNRGWGEFANALESEGYQLTQLIEQPNVPIDLTSINISQYDVVVFGSNNATYSTASIDELENYVRSGGAALFISDANFGSNWGDAPDSDQDFLDRFGWTMNQDQGTYAINTVDFLVPNHPIFDNVASFDGEGVSPITLSDSNVTGVSSTILANAKDVVRRNNRMGRGRSEMPTANDAAIIIATVDQGRIAGHFDRNTFFNLNGAGTDINRLSNEQYAINLINWLSGCNSNTCTPNTPCDDGDDCTINDTFDANCNCIGTFQDSDMDGVCDADDLCEGASDVPLDISGALSMNETYRALDSIYSDAQIASSLDITYESGRIITLGADFSVENGATFSASIRSCPTARLASYNRQIEDRVSSTKQQTAIQIYPNPLRTSTNIQYHLAAPDWVQIDIFDASGRQLQQLVQTNYQEAGTHQIQWQVSERQQGLYFVRIAIGEQVYMKRIVVQ
ncbi:MAG: T9SS type A sorting domain-containing protein [Bacteroidota bacterium]